MRFATPRIGGICYTNISSQIIWNYFHGVYFILFFRSTVISSLSSTEAVDLKYARGHFCMGRCYNFCRWHRPSCACVCACACASCMWGEKAHLNSLIIITISLHANVKGKKERERRRRENGQMWVQEQEQKKQKKTIGDYIDAVDRHRHRHRYTLWARE